MRSMLSTACRNDRCQDSSLPVRHTCGKLSGRAADSRAATGFQCFLTAAILHLLQIAWREVIEEGGISSLLGQIAVYATKSLRFRQKG
jgi:hypothetical protein